MPRISLALLLVALLVFPSSAFAQTKKWYGVSNLPNGTGESIFDATAQWMLLGASGRGGATDSGHITGILVMARVSGTITNIYSMARSNTWNAGGSWALRWTDCGTSVDACASPSYSTTTIGWADLATGADSDLTTSLTVTSGRLYQWEWTRTGGGSGDLRIPFLTYAFTPSSGDSFQMAGGEKGDLTTASVTRYLPPWGDNANSTEINSSRIKVLVDGSVTGFDTRVFSNLRTTNTVFCLQLNGTDIGSCITYTSTLTGFLSDAGYGSPVAVVNGDYLSVRATTLTGGELMEYTAMVVTINPTADEFEVGPTSGAGIVIAQGTTRYLTPIGDATLVTSTDGNAKVPAPFNLTLDRCRGYIRANSLGGGQALTLSLRINGTVSRTMTWNSGSGAAEAAFSDTTAINISQGQDVDLVATATGGSGSAHLMNFECRGVEQSTASSKRLTLVGVGAQQ